MKTVWIVLISFVATAVIVGGGTYYFINAKAKTDKDALQAQIATLTTKVADTEESLANIQAVNSVATTQTTTSTPATNPTASLKTYNNTPFAYNVKIPQDATYTELTTGDSSNPKTGYIVSFVINNLPIRINAMDNSRSDKTLEALIETRNNVGMPLFVDDKNVHSTITVNNERAFQYITSYGDYKSNGLNTLLLGDKFYYQITASAGKMENPSDMTDAQKKIYNDFVSTFQLVK